MDYAAARSRMLAAQSKGELNEMTLLELTRVNRYTDMIAALSLLCGAPMPLVENFLQSEHREAWLIPCRVAGLDWSTVRAILACPSIGRAMSGQALDASRTDYFRLSQTSAGRVLRFWQVRQTAAKDAAKPELSTPSVSQRSDTDARSAEPAVMGT